MNKKESAVSLNAAFVLLQRLQRENPGAALVVRLRDDKYVVEDS